MRNNLKSLGGKWYNLILVLKCHSECCDGEEGASVKIGELARTIQNYPNEK